MYRIVCESFIKFQMDFVEREEDARYKAVAPIELILKPKKYHLEKEKKTEKYKKLATFLWRVQSQPQIYPEFKSLIWTLESRGIEGKDYNALSEDVFEEMVKTVRMFLRLAYWQ